ncbi:hypothetical protein BC938DRAFT_480171, partial [Jimgerdemannia flammicorona]
WPIWIRSTHVKHVPSCASHLTPREISRWRFTHMRLPTRSCVIFGIYLQGWHGCAVAVVVCCRVNLDKTTPSPLDTQKMKCNEPGRHPSCISDTLMPCDDLSAQPSLRSHCCEWGTLATMLEVRAGSGTERDNRKLPTFHQRFHITQPNLCRPHPHTAYTMTNLPNEFFYDFFSIIDYITTAMTCTAW